MEWTLLCLLVPAVLVPVVMLCGFAGCQLIFTLDDTVEPRPPLPPALLPGRPTGATSIALSWESTDPSAVKFAILRALVGGTLTQIAETTASSFLDSTGLEEGKTYLYAVMAFNVQDLASVQSNIVSVALVFRTAFAADVSEIEPGRLGDCVVQKIGAFNFADPANPANLANVTGGVLRLSIRGSVNLRIDRIFISQAAIPSGANPQPDPWDAAADLTLVASNVTLATGADTPLPTVAYLLDPSRDLLVAFDINPAIGSGDLGFATVSGPIGYLRPATAEAGIAGGNRSPDFEDRPDQLFLVAKIEVI